MQPLMISKPDGSWKLASNFKPLNKSVKNAPFDIPKEKRRFSKNSPTISFYLS